MLPETLWIFARQPLLLLFSMGFALSLASSNRLSLRTTADGMISFAFLVFAELAGIVFVYLRSDGRMTFADAVDRFFANNRPWLLWILVFVTWETLTHGLTRSLTGATEILATLIVPAAWAAYLDVRFFQILLGRQAVAVDLIAARAISWTIALGYFFGIAAWAQIAGWLR
jgi:hypothetical protein